LPQIDAVIISDLVYNRVHPWLAKGRSDPWLKALAKANRCFASATVLYAGHGRAGSPSIKNGQAACINAVQEIVARAVNEDPGLSDASRAAAIQRRVRASYKNWPLEMIIDMNTIDLTGEVRSETWKQAPAVDRPPALTSTLFVNVKNDMTIAQDEILGPMLRVIAYDSEDEAVHIANDSRYRSFSTLTKRA
jgi:hypothetical protein